MTDIPESSSIDEEYKTNVDLSYDYIEKSIKEIQSKSNNTNTELGLLIGFNLTFIRFFIGELPGKIYDLDFLPCNSCLILKIFAYIFAVASIICCLLGLYTRTKYFIIPPNILVNNCDEVSSVEFKLAIMETWQAKLNNFLKLAKKKKVLFNYSIFFLVLSGLMAAIDGIIAYVFYLNL